MSDSISSAGLNCSICSEYFTDPRLLPCLHVYCKSCLDSVYDEGTLTCPSCYKVTTSTTTQGYISTLPKHLRIERQVNLLKLQQCSNEVVCGSCEDNTKAEAYCIDCDSPVCSSCVTSHKKLKMLKNHSITTLDSAKPQTSVISCSIHTRELVKYYCCECACLLCNECIMKHKDHELMLIDEAAESEVSKLKPFLPKLEQFVKPVNGAIKEFTVAIKSIATKQKLLVTNIEEAFQKIIKGVERRRDEVIREISGLLMAQQARLQMQMEEMEKGLINLKLALNTTSLLCNDYSPPEILAISKSVQNASESVLKSIESSSKAVIDNSYPEFRYDQSQVDKAISLFGKLAHFSSCPSLCSLVDVNPNMSIGVGCGIESCLTLQTRNSKGEDLKVGGADIRAAIEGLDVLLDCEIEDCDDGQYKIVFSINTPGQFKLCVTVDEVDIGDSPYSVTSIDYNHVFDAGPQTIKSTVPYSPQYAVWGEVTGSLYVTTDEGHVLVYNKGMSLKKIILKEKLGSKNLRGILVDEEDGVMLLVDSGSHSIIKADLDGNVVMLDGGKGNDELQFNLPTGLGRTKEGLILVGDHGNEELQILNPDLTYHSYIECGAPVWGVSVDSDNLIHVGTKEGVKVYKIEESDGAYEIVGYKNELVKGIHFPNYQFDSTYSLVTNGWDLFGDVSLYNWVDNEVIASWSIGDHPVGIAINQEGVVCVCCSGDNDLRVHSPIKYKYI